MKSNQMNDKTITFIPSGRGKAQCPPNPDYPHGITIPAPRGCMVSCEIRLPYPAPECGVFRVACLTCRMTMMITAAGRPDDPVSLRLPCELPTKVQ